MLEAVRRSEDGPFETRSGLACVPRVCASACAACLGSLIYSRVPQNEMRAAALPLPIVLTGSEEDAGPVGWRLVFALTGCGQQEGNKGRRQGAPARRASRVRRSRLPVRRSRRGIEPDEPLMSR